MTKFKFSKFIETMENSTKSKTNKNLSYYIQCNTKEESETIAKLLHAYGYYRRDGDSYYADYYKDGQLTISNVPICYSSDGTYAIPNSYYFTKEIKNNYFEIIDFKDVDFDGIKPSTNKKER